MLSDVNNALQRLLYERGLIDPRDVDVEFDAPVKAWVNSLTRPTVNFFLFDVEENTDLRQTGMQATRGNGVGTYRMPPRRFDFRYMVSALSTVVEDEHLLLWRTLVTLMKYQKFPSEVLPDSLRGLEPPLVTKVNKPDDSPRALDIWGALETPPRPALIYVVTTPVDLDIAIQAPLVLTRTARYTRMLSDEREFDGRALIGGVVRDRHGARLAGATVSVEGRAAPDVTTNSDGEFRLASLSVGALTLRVAHASAKTPKLVKIQIPSDSYDIVLD